MYGVFHAMFIAMVRYLTDLRYREGCLRKRPACGRSKHRKGGKYEKNRFRIALPGEVGISYKRQTNFISHYWSIDAISLKMNVVRMFYTHFLNFMIVQELRKGNGLKFISFVKMIT